MVALIQSENHAANKGKTAGRYQFDTHPTGIGLIGLNTIEVKNRYQLEHKKHIFRMNISAFNTFDSWNLDTKPKNQIRIMKKPFDN